MSRREQTIAHDPKSEAAVLEAEALKGRVAADQNRILDLAGNKKQLEADFEAAKKRMDDDLAQKRREVDEEKIRLEGSNITLKEINKGLVSSNESLTKANADLDALVESKKAFAAKHTGDLEKLQADIKMFNDSIEKANKRVAEISADIVTLELKKGTLTKEVEELQQKKDKLQSQHEEVAENFDTATISLEASTAAKKKTDDEMAGVVTSLGEKKKELADLGDQIFKASSELASAKADKQKLDADTHEKMGALSRLEQHVDGKIEILKEAKSQFTTEHLLRMGIKD